jgi:hypothetical protein
MRKIRVVTCASLAAAAIAAFTASPAYAEAPTNEHNCYGAGQSGNVAGKGGLPGSKTDPAPGFRDPETGGPTWNGPVTSFVAQQPGETDKGNALSDFQQSSRDAAANCGGTSAP